MKRQILTATLIALAGGLPASAGTLVDGQWTAAGCGTPPGAPKLDFSDVDAYNRSVEQITDWQRKAQAYNDCIVQEANADNAAIAKSANAEQEKFRSAVDEINAASQAARSKLERP